jgi:serine/threonine-protein kinase
VQSKLSGLSELRVIGTTSTRPYKGTDKTGQQIGQELGADYILAMTVQWQRTTSGSSRVRVVPQLIDASDDTQLWSESYEEAMSNAFELQSRVASRVIEALDVVLLEPEQRLFGERPTRNAEAWEYYLKGRALVSKGLTAYVGGAGAAAHDAVDAFESAVRFDSGFAAAYAQLAFAHYAVAFNGDDRSDARFAMMHDAAEAALQLAPGLPEAKMALGLYHYRLGQGDYASALREMEPALARQPNNPFFLTWIANVQRRHGRHREAAANYAMSAEIDPLDFNTAREAALTYLRLRDYDQAQRYLDRSDAIGRSYVTYLRRALLFLMRDGDEASAVEAMLQMRTDGVPLWNIVATNVGIAAPRHVAVHVFCMREGCQEAVDHLGCCGDSPWYVHIQGARLHAILGNRELERTYSDSAVAELENLVRDQPRHLRAKGYLVSAYAGAGQAEMVRREGERLRALQLHLLDALYGPDVLQVLAEAYVRIGDRDEAIDLLELVLSVPSGVSGKLLGVDPVWEPLRDHPRFQALLERYDESER